ncbi:Conserved_hypothetical protein [Hexamita inflata]|uniref:Uncharacterized protein n=1 Tax=Hexamita inflata TaxID=28002 RepID=A0AA86Q5X3_9EUKA|nr:Conserved hypothetical protein [Hexamita inflata]
MFDWLEETSKLLVTENPIIDVFGNKQLYTSFMGMCQTCINQNSLVSTDMDMIQCQFYDKITLGSLSFRYGNYSNASTEPEQLKLSPFELNISLKPKNVPYLALFIDQITPDIPVDFFDQVVLKNNLTHSQIHFLLVSDNQNLELVTQKLKKMPWKYSWTCTSSKQFCEKSLEVQEWIINELDKNYQKQTSEYKNEKTRIGKYKALQQIFMNIHLMTYQPKKHPSLVEQLKINRMSTNYEIPYYKYGGRKCAQGFLKRYQALYQTVLNQLEDITMDMQEMSPSDKSTQIAIQCISYYLLQSCAPNKFWNKSLEYAQVYLKNEMTETFTIFAAFGILNCIFMEIRTKFDVEQQMNKKLDVSIERFVFDHQLDQTLSTNLQNLFLLNSDVIELLPVTYQSQINTLFKDIMELLFTTALAIKSPADKIQLFSLLLVVSDEVCATNKNQQQRLLFLYQQFEFLLKMNWSNGSKINVADFLLVFSQISELTHLLSFTNPLFVDGSGKVGDLTFQNQLMIARLLAVINNIINHTTSNLYQIQYVFEMSLVQLNALEMIRKNIQQRFFPGILEFQLFSQVLVSQNFNKMTKLQIDKVMAIQASLCRELATMRENMNQLVSDDIHLYSFDASKASQLASKVKTQYITFDTEIQIPVKFQVNNNYLGSDIEIIIQPQVVFASLTNFLKFFKVITGSILFKLENEQILVLKFSYQPGQTEQNIVFKFKTINYPITCTQGEFTVESPSKQFIMNQSLVLNPDQIIIQMDENIQILAKASPGQPLFLKPSQQRIQIQSTPAYQQAICGMMYPIQFKLLNTCLVPINDCVFKFTCKSKQPFNFSLIQDGRIVDCQFKTNEEQFDIISQNQFTVKVNQLNTKSIYSVIVRQAIDGVCQVNCQLVGENVVNMVNISFRSPMSLRYVQRPLYYAIEFESDIKNMIIKDILTQQEVDVFNLHDVLGRELNQNDEDISYDSKEKLADILVKQPYTSAYFSLLDSKISQFSDPSVLSRPNIYRSAGLSNQEKTQIKVFQKIELKSAYMVGFDGNRGVVVVFEVKSVSEQLEQFVEETGNQGLLKILAQGIVYVIVG